MTHPDDTAREATMNICGNCEETFDPSQSDAPMPDSFCSAACQAVFTG